MIRWSARRCLQHAHQLMLVKLLRLLLKRIHQRLHKVPLPQQQEASESQCMFASKLFKKYVKLIKSEWKTQWKSDENQMKIRWKSAVFMTNARNPRGSAPSRASRDARWSAALHAQPQTLQAKRNFFESTWSRNASKETFKDLQRPANGTELSGIHQN